MPRVRFLNNAAIKNKAYGLEGPQTYAKPGDEIEVSDATLKAMQERMAPTTFEVIEPIPPHRPEMDAPDKPPRRKKKERAT